MTTTMVDTAAHSAGYSDKLLLPQWAEIVKIVPEAEGVSTFHLKFTDPEVQSRYRFAPGQFNMLYVPGDGEAAISMSSDFETASGLLVHTIRHIGNVTRATSRLKIGDVVGIRGPFGTSWPLDAIEGMDVVIACGGIGLPPLRGAIYHIIRNRAKYGKITLLYGARTPKDLMFPSEYEAWQKADMDIQVTVDRGDDSWTGRVGVVPMWFYHFRVDPHKTAVLTCGPEIMMRFVIYEALARRIPSENIYVSLERNMKCGQGACGHCQQGPYFICKDGPVFPFKALENIFNVEEY
jgi:2-polyprenylphenol hydroxylase and related flavodoxin oxidoreductases